MDPPSPEDKSGFPKYYWADSLNALYSHQLQSGQFHPGPYKVFSKLTCALQGGLCSNIYLSYFNFYFVFKVGGLLTLILTLHYGPNTFPDLSAYGNPLTPVTVKVGFHVLFNTNYKLLSVIALVSLKKGNNFTASCFLISTNSQAYLYLLCGMLT